MSPQGAGYSGTPLPRKLGIKAGAKLALVNAPGGFDDTLGELPPGVVVRRRAQGAGFDVIVAFCSGRAQLERGLARWRTALDVAGGLWIAWPKCASGIETNLGDGVVRD